MLITNKLTALYWIVETKHRQKIQEAQAAEGRENLGIPGFKHRDKYFREGHATITLKTRSFLSETKAQDDAKWR